MRPALTMLLAIFVALPLGRAAMASVEVGDGGCAISSDDAATTLQACGGSALETPLARRWEGTEPAWRPALADDADDSPLTQKDVRSAELLFRPALASAMSLVEQTPMLKDGAGAWPLRAPLRPAAETHRVRGRQSDP